MKLRTHIRRLLPVHSVCVVFVFAFFFPLNAREVQDAPVQLCNRCVPVHSQAVEIHGRDGNQQTIYLEKDVAQDCMYLCFHYAPTRYGALFIPPDRCYRAQRVDNPGNSSEYACWYANKVVLCVAKNKQPLLYTTTQQAQK